MAMRIPGITGNPSEYAVPRQAPAPGPESRPVPADAAEPVFDRADVRRAVETLQEASRLLNHRLKFSVNEEINRVVVKVVDGTTDKVIKEIPPEEIQKLIARIKETLGLLFDEMI
jgi:flagellar protein FlaG